MTRHIALISALLTLAVWLVFSWPLPRHAADAVPMSHSGGENASVRTMEPGDHLQLMYYFWLFKDMVAGNTPWMYNPYEFNTGDEEARYQPEAYYAPFSWVYGLIEPFGGRALAYNTAGVVSLWVTVLLTWLLIRRYVENTWICGGMAVLAIMLPYRWFTLLGGSPTGFGMAMAPLLLWGLDRAVRDRSIAGGCWAAAAIIFSYTSDLHMFFFNVLLTPAWCLVAFVAKQEFEWKNWKAYTRLAVPLLPVATGLLLVILYSRGVADQLADTHMAEGRSIQEVMKFSPNRTGLLGWTDDPMHGQIYIGFGLPLLIAAGGIVLVRRALSRQPGAIRDLVIYGLLLAGIGLIILLALGPHGPRHGWVFMKARALLSEYGMIRQTGKIFGILPPILALVAAMGIHQISGSRKKVARLLTLIALLVTGWEYGRRIHPPVCRLIDEQAAYAAVAESAAAQGERAHALIVTLWPGDSHYASIYQYYASLYRIRMVNGYTPAINQDYFTNMFLRFQTINQGWMTDEQADELLSRGINHLIVHEDLFPYKVSPFPIAYTLHRLRNHPRLEFLKQSGPVWAFRLKPGPSTQQNKVDELSPLFSERHWLFHALPARGGTIVDDPTAGRGKYLRLDSAGALVETMPDGCPPAGGLYYYIRVRGSGSFNASVMIGEKTQAAMPVTVDNPDWKWTMIPFALEAYSAPNLRIELTQGSLDFCSALLAAGSPLKMAPGEATNRPAALFFHAGYLDPSNGHVYLKGKQDRPGHVFYGPKLPVDNGQYTITMHASSPAPSGSVMGRLLVEQLFMTSDHPSVDVRAGQTTRLVVHFTNNLPFNLIFDYDAHADVEIESISIQRDE